jgi:hypothetical protein
MQINLSNTTESLELETLVAGSIHYKVGYTDITSSGVSTPAVTRGIVTTVTTTTIVAAPAASTTRKIQYLNVYNNDVTNTIIIKDDVSSVENISLKVVLQNGECLRIVNDIVNVLDASGRVKQQSAEQATASGQNYLFYKIGTVPKAAGTLYATFKDSGFPGAWLIGTPGLNGTNIDGSLAANAGLIGFANPSSGAMYLRNANISATVQCGIKIWDLLWYNSGLTLPAGTQLISQPVLPARDLNGTTNGEQVGVALYVSTTLTNAVAISLTTISYTNSAGVSGRTATISSVSVTPIVGQIFIFQLQTGDTGVRSIQNFNTGTAYTSPGAISLFCFRAIDSISALAINSGANGAASNIAKDIRLYNGTALAVIQLASTTTATSFDGSIQLINK